MRKLHVLYRRFQNIVKVRATLECLLSRQTVQRLRYLEVLDGEDAILYRQKMFLFSIVNYFINNFSKVSEKNKQHVFPNLVRFILSLEKCNYLYEYFLLKLSRLGGLLDIASAPSVEGRWFKD